MNYSAPRVFLPLLLLAVVSTGCGGSAAPPARLEASAAERVDDGWAEFLRNPGTPGVDYDPATIMVGYRLGAELPGFVPGGTAGVAATRRNPMLRENRQFEPLTDAIAGRYGLTIDSQVYLRQLNFASFILPEGADGEAVLAAIRADFADAIEYAAWAPLIYACWEPNDPLYTDSTTSTGAQWSLKKSRFNEAWDITTGVPGVRIAVVDTGCYMDHQEFGGQVLNPQVEFPTATCDIANNDNTMEDNVDHGTFLCGLVGAKANEGVGMTGAAPGCRVIPIKISEDGSANHGRFVEGCMLGFTLGAKVVNLSWRSTGGSPPLLEMVNDIYNGGGLLFVSAGNDGTDAQTWPAAYGNAVAVGNSNAADGRVASSSFGNWVDIAAPGDLLGSTGNHEVDDYHGPFSGTSFSAPLTAAAAALLWSHAPELTNADVRNYLQTTGQPTTGFNDGDTILRLDVKAAFDALPQVVVEAEVSAVVVDRALLGTIPNETQFLALVQGPQNVSRINYYLDCRPLGVDGPEDVTVDAFTGASFPAQLSVSVASRPNQQAELRATPYNADGDAGAVVTTPVYIFNVKGDVNADGKVNAADAAAYGGRGGQVSSDPEYIPFFDTDLDGRITEQDAAAVGYFWAP